jgi:glycosyltransferase involved in cell wall biosynthesis
VNDRPDRKGAVVVVRTLLTAFGGAEHAAALHALGLQRRGYDVAFLTAANFDPAHPYCRMLEVAGVRLVTPTPWTARALVRRIALALRPVALPFYLMLRPKGLRDAWSSLAAIVDTLLHRLEHRSVIGRIRACARRSSSLVVHIYGQEGLTPVIAAWGAAVGVPVVYTETGEADAVYANRFNLKGTIDRINVIPLVICCGPRVTSNIRSVYGYSGPVAEIPFLIEEPRPFVPREPLRDEIVVGIVGRLVEHKGHRDAIWGVARLRAEGLPVRLIVAGDGPSRDTLRRYADEQGATDVVQFTGRFEHVSDVLSTVDIVVLPSTSEGQPLAITEAMAYGKPVVSTWFGGIPDLVAHERTGLLVTPGDRDDFVSALRRVVLDGDLRRRMGESARADYLARRSTAVVLDRIEHAYRTVHRAVATRASAHHEVVAVSAHVVADRQS